MSPAERGKLFDLLRKTYLTFASFPDGTGAS